MKKILLVLHFLILLCPVLKAETIQTKTVNTVVNDLVNFEDIFTNVNPNFNISLVDNPVNSFFQTAQGTLLLGTRNGLYTYDGQKVKLFTDSRKKVDFDTFEVRQTFEDAKQQIWMLTYDSVIVWNPIYDETVSLDITPIKKDRPFLFLKGYLFDGDGNIWLYGYKSLYCYNQSAGKFVDYSHLLEGKTSTIFSLFIDRQNRFWVVTDDQMLQLHKSVSSAGIVEYCLNKSAVFNDGRFTQIRGIFQDSHNYIWLYTRSELLRVDIDDETNQLREIEHITFKNKDSHFFNSMIEHNGNVYIVSSAGLIRYSLTNRSSIIATKIVPSEDANISRMRILDLFVDSEQTLWVSTSNYGVFSLSPYTRNFNNYSSVEEKLLGTNILDMAKDENSRVWFALQGEGVLCWNTENNQFQTFNQHTVPTFPTNNIRKILPFGDDLFLLAGNRYGLIRLWRMNINTKKVSLCKLPPSAALPLNDLTLMSVRNATSLWLGTSSGLFFWDIHTNEFIHNKYVNESVDVLLSDDSSSTWVLTRKGIYRLDADGEECQFIELTEAIRPNALVKIHNQFYIASKYGGLYRGSCLMDATDPLERIEAFDNITIHTMVANGDYVCLATNRGLYLLDTSTDVVRFFNKADGLNSNSFLYNVGLTTDDGILLLGDQSGLTCFRPSSMKFNTVPPKVVLTDLYVQNKSVKVGEPDSPLSKSFSYADKVTLHESDHNIGFGFSSSSFHNTTKNIYEYRLDPLDRDWVKNNGLQFVFYNNLHPGNYTFRVRSANGESDWSEEATVQLCILPYWWKSFWMIVVYVLLTIALMVLAFLLYKKKLQKEQELFEFQKEQELYHTKMNFFTCMAHEVRTPLTLIMGPLVTLLKDKETLRKFEPELKVMERNSQRLLQLVNKLMDFRKIEEDAYSIQLAAVDIREVLEQVTDDFILTNRNAKLTINVQIPERECWAWVEREAFVKVCNNLLSNACKFAATTITVGLHLSADASQWELTVTDDGCGISPENQTKIFDSFYQVYDNQRSDFLGTGIGLFVVRRLVELQKGSITLTSEVNKGTCFKVCFAYKELQIDEQIIEQEKTKGAQTVDILPAGNNEGTLKKRVLVVEDNEDMRNYIASIFNDGFEIHTCENGKQALLKIAEANYHLIITDLMMPVMDGMTLLKVLKNDVVTCHIPVILLTAKADEESQIEGFEERADAYVTKPFVANVLFSQVTAILKNRDVLYRRFQQDADIPSVELCCTSRDRSFITKVDEYIQAHLTNVDLCVDELAADVGLGRSIFYRKMKSLTGMTPNDYIRTFRLKKAMELLKSGEYRINEVCYYVGFSSPSYFTKRFTALFGCTPSDMLKKI